MAPKRPQHLCRPSAAVIVRNITSRGTTLPVNDYDDDDDDNDDEDDDDDESGEGTMEDAPPTHLNLTPPPPTSTSHPELIAIVRRHFEEKGYRVRSGLQFGCELVLYADDPGRVHSDFCVHVPPPPSAPADGDDGGDDDDDGDHCGLDWRTVQTLARSMPDLRKTLIVARVRRRRCKDPGRERGASNEGEAGGGGGGGGGRGDGRDDYEDDDDAGREYEVDELAIATEHAPFRHKNVPLGVGTQVKSPRGGRR